MMNSINETSTKSLMNQMAFDIAIDHYEKDCVMKLDDATLNINVRDYALQYYPNNPVEGIMDEARQMTAPSDIEFLDSHGINTMAIVEEVVRESIREHAKLYDLAMKLGRRLIQKVVDKKEAAGTLSIF